MTETTYTREPIPVDVGDMTAYERGVIDRLDLILAELRGVRADNVVHHHADSVVLSRSEPQRFS